MIGPNTNPWALAAFAMATFASLVGAGGSWWEQVAYANLRCYFPQHARADQLLTTCRRRT